MGKINILLALMILLCLNASGQNDENDIEGTWELDRKENVLNLDGIEPISIGATKEASLKPEILLRFKDNQLDYKQGRQMYKVNYTLLI